MKIIFLFLLYFIFQIKSALAIEILCPNEIVTTQNLNKLPSEGWEGFDYHPQISNKLQGIGLFSGPPNDDALLIPDNKKEPYGWTIKPKDELGYWAACRYSNTRIYLVKRIPNGVSKCTYKHKDKQKQVGYLDCK